MIRLAQLVPLLLTLLALPVAGQWEWASDPVLFRKGVPQALIWRFLGVLAHLLLCPWNPLFLGSPVCQSLPGKKKTKQWWPFWTLHWARYKGSVQHHLNSLKTERADKPLVHLIPLVRVHQVNPTNTNSTKESLIYIKKTMIDCALSIKQINSFSSSLWS